MHVRMALINATIKAIYKKKGFRVKTLGFMWEIAKLVAQFVRLYTAETNRLCVRSIHSTMTPRKQVSKKQKGRFYLWPKRSLNLQYKWNCKVLDDLSFSIKLCKLVLSIKTSILVGTLPYYAGNATNGFIQVILIAHTSLSLYGSLQTMGSFMLALKI